MRTIKFLQVTSIKQVLQNQGYTAGVNVYSLVIDSVNLPKNVSLINKLDIAIFDYRLFFKVVKMGGLCWPHLVPHWHPYCRCSENIDVG